MTKEEIKALVGRLRSRLDPFTADAAADLIEAQAKQNAELRRERDVYLDNWKEARTYMTIETRHAEQAEAERDAARAEVERLRLALRSIKGKAGSHTVSDAAVQRGIADPGFAGIYAVADAALASRSDKP